MHNAPLKVSELLQMRMSLADKHKETLLMIENLQGRVLDDELIRWKREQQLAGNGVPFHSNLDTIQVCNAEYFIIFFFLYFFVCYGFFFYLIVFCFQEWCESLAELIWLNRQQIKESERLRIKFPITHPNSADLIPTLNNQVTQLLSSLVTR